MTKQDILSELERQMGPLDERARRAAMTALDLAVPTATQLLEPAPSQQALEWEGKNPPFEEMAKLPEEERIRIMDELSDANADWLERKRIELGARWMLVVDGEVLMHGPTWQNYPLDEEIKELCHKTGKMLLLHTAPLLIEEGTPWHPTIYPTDVYPTLPVVFSGNGQSVDVVADLDTGSSEVYADADLLGSRGVIQIGPFIPWRRDTHLGRGFWFTTKQLGVTLTAADGSQRSAVHRILCIHDWAQSPLVAISPTRTALVGRDLCLLLQPQITLDFVQHQTTVRW